MEGLDLEVDGSFLDGEDTEADNIVAQTSDTIAEPAVKKKRGRPSKLNAGADGDFSLGETPSKRIKVSESVTASGSRGKKVASRAKGGQKFCNACNKTNPVESFPSGSAQCAPMRQPAQNLRNMATAQGELEWFLSIYEDPAKLVKLVTISVRIR